MLDVGFTSFPLTRGFGFEIWYSKLKLKGVSWSCSEAGWVGLGLSAVRIMCLWAILLSSGTADLCPFLDWSLPSGSSLNSDS